MSTTPIRPNGNKSDKTKKFASYAGVAAAAAGVGVAATAAAANTEEEEVVVEEMHEPAANPAQNAAPAQAAAPAAQPAPSTSRLMNLWSSQWKNLPKNP